MIVLIIFIVVLERGQFNVVLAFYVSKKIIIIKTRKEELVYASTVSTKSSIILKDSLII